MINIYDIRRFYSSTLDFLLNKMYDTSTLIISSDKIEDKIKLGLSLSNLWVTATHLRDRLELMATPPIIKNFTSNDCSVIQTKESILERCEEILRYKSDVLLAHEIETVNLVSTQLSMSLNIESSSGVAEFPPARSSEMKLSMGKTFHANSNQELVSNPDTYVSFLYYVLVDVEISAMEICAHMILSNKSMPIEFTLDITKQIWDEARHAQFIYELFLKTGGRIRDHSYTNTVIDRYLHSETLLEALIIQQILQEGNAVEVNLSLIEELLSLKRLSEANAFYNINNDEAYHVTIGNKWINYLVMADEIQEEELLQIMLAAADKIDIPLFGKGGWNSEIRELVGFPSWFIEVRDRIFSS